MTSYPGWKIFYVKNHHLHYHSFKMRYHNVWFSQKLILPIYPYLSGLWRHIRVDFSSNVKNRNLHCNSFQMRYHKLGLVVVYEFLYFLLFFWVMTSYPVQNGQNSRGSGKFSKEEYQTMISWKFQPVVRMRSGSCANYSHYTVWLRSIRMT